MKKIIFPAGILCLILLITACHNPYVDPDSIHTVTFSAEGGVFDNAANRLTIQTDAKGRISSLPAVTRVTYNFIGWFTPGGTRVTAQTVFHDDTLVVAIWKDPDAGNTDGPGPFADALQGLMNDPKGSTLTLFANENLGPQSFEFEGLETPVKITLTSAGAPANIYTISLAGFGSLFTVGNNVTLELQYVRLQGHGSNTASLIDIKAGGKVIIGNGTVITGNDTESIRHGGGVTVHVGGELEMPAGTTGLIYQNSSAHASDWLSGNIGGGGVWVRGGKFTMNGGRIEENYAMGAGGVLVTMGGEFTMNGGAIVKCIANAVAGGVRVAGYRADAVPITIDNPNAHNPDGRIGSKFTMNGGEITECEGSSGGGVELGWGGTFTMTGGKIYKNIGLSGGGVCNLYGVVLLYGNNYSDPNIADNNYVGARIYQNNALGEAGGLMNAGHCEMWGGKIYDNESLGHGGGVMHSPTGSGLLHNFFMYDGEISGNTAQGGGGGLYTIASFDMYGGKIINNTAHSTGGGGVLVGSPSLLLDYGEFTITDGDISGNTSYASGASSSNLAVRGLGKARTAKLGVYWFKSSFTETITEFTPVFDGNGNYILDENGRILGDSQKKERTFESNELSPNVPGVPIYSGRRDEGGVFAGYKDLYFIKTPLAKPSGSTPYTPEARSRVQGSFRIAIGEPRVEIITETQPVAETFEVIIMDMDAAKFSNNVDDNIIVVDGVVQP
jgi:hypothetical protein